MAKVGFIGLGVMGSQMVNRLLSQGHAVTGESVLGMLNHEFLQFLPARFGLFGHMQKIVYGRARD